jgi:hypothetical protein
MKKLVQGEMEIGESSREEKGQVVGSTIRGVAVP